MFYTHTLPAFRSFTVNHQNSGSTWTPAMNAREYSDRYEIDLNIGKIDPKQVNLEVKDGEINIHFESKTETEESGFTWLRREFRNSSFSRSFVIPDDADEKGIEASYEKGILTLTLKKVEKEPSQKIVINIRE